MRGANVLLSGLIGLGVFHLQACKTASLEQGAESVSASSNPAPAGCTSLGYLIGKGGGTFGGAALGNETLIEYAMNDLRNQANALGANYIQNDPPQLGSGDGTTTTATITGTAYRCDDSAAAAQGPGATAPPNGAPGQAPSARSAPPTGAAGFTFGQSVEESAEACTGAGHEWNPGKEDHFKCSGTPSDVGFPATALVRFCDDKLCGLSVTTVPDSEESKVWINTFVGLKEALEKKYGAPAKDDKTLPSECRGKDFHACLVDGRAQFVLDWSWPSKEHVRAAMRKTTQGAAIQLQYFKVQTGPNSDAL